MEEPVDPQPRRIILLTSGDLRGLDSVDNCRMRLLTLRARIETNWPTVGHFLRRGQGLAAESQASISDLLIALPTPLPLHAGGEPEMIICATDTDLRAVAGRAVDAGLALLEGSTLETIYRGEVSMLESHRAGAREPIVVSDPTVGLLVATIIGTLEAISESVNESAAKASAVRAAGGRSEAAPSGPGKGDGGVQAQPAKPRRVRRVPRI